MLEKAHEKDKLAKKELDEKLDKYTNKEKQQGALWENIKEFSKPTHFVVIGFIMAFLIGCIIPSYGFILPRMMYGMLNDNKDEIMPEVNFWALLMFLAAVGYGLFSFVSKYSFSQVGSNIGKNCQSLLYKSLLTKDLGWHDQIEHSAGIVTVILSKDCALIEGAATESSAVGL
jgi:ATP-binding cassette subfamily B (MDR/TAP) protein 1